MTKRSWPGWAHPSLTIKVQALLQGGLTSCQNCVESLPDREDPSPSASAFSFLGGEILRKFQFLGYIVSKDNRKGTSVSLRCISSLPISLHF